MCVDNGTRKGILRGDKEISRELENKEVMVMASMLTGKQKEN